jgi:hypothetical protein
LAARQWVHELIFARPEAAESVHHERREKWDQRNAKQGRRHRALPQHDGIAEAVSSQT